MLKKVSLILTVIFIVAFVFSGCEPSKPPVTLSPPTWIQGDWHVNSSSADVKFLSFSFSNDDIIASLAIGGNPFSFKEGYSSSKITESSTSTNYTINILFMKNQITYKFNQINQNLMTFEYILNGVSYICEYIK